MDMEGRRPGVIERFDYADRLAQCLAFSNLLDILTMCSSRNHLGHGSFGAVYKATFQAKVYLYCPLCLVS